MPRFAIVDIRHPGRRWLWAGAAFEAVGVLLLGAGYYFGHQDTSGVLGPAVVGGMGASAMIEGLPMLIWGTAAQLRSRAAARLPPGEMGSPCGGR